MACFMSCTTFSIDEYTWRKYGAPLHMICDHGNGEDAGTDGFTVYSCNAELDQPRHIRFSRRYPLGSLIGHTDTPFR